jgi:hypothetical protein
MVLLKPENITRELVGAPRAVTSIYGIQRVKPVWWSKKALVLRPQPYTVVNPHIGQMQARVHFAEIASRHRGERGFKGGLPVVAYAIKTEMKGYTAPRRLPKEEYIKQRGPHTAEELKERLKAIGESY